MTQFNILTNQSEESTEFKLETKDEILAKVDAIQKLIDCKTNRLT